MTAFACQYVGLLGFTCIAGLLFHAYLLSTLIAVRFSVLELDFFHLPLLISAPVAPNFIVPTWAGEAKIAWAGEYVLRSRISSHLGAVSLLSSTVTSA